MTRDEFRELLARRNAYWDEEHRVKGMQRYHETKQDRLMKKRKLRTTPKQVAYARSGSEALVNQREFTKALDYLDRLINPDLYRDEQGKLRNKRSGKECFDTYRNPEAKGDPGRSLSPEEIKEWMASRASQ